MLRFSHGGEESASRIRHTAGFDDDPTKPIDQRRLLAALSRSLKASVARF